jgi:2Fe-2S ferredoxin
MPTPVCTIAERVGSPRYHRSVPTITFVASHVGSEKTVDAPEGGELVDICDHHLAPIPFSCRSATCGTCHVRVLSGGEHLEPPADDERELLEVLRGGPDTRLACQVVVKRGDGTVEVEPIGW